MTEWEIALVTAASAIAGGGITGWFSRSAGAKQAEAARQAGDRQADAMLATVRMTLEEQRTARVLDMRRQTYVKFLEAADTAISTRRTGEGHRDDRPALQRAFGAVLLEGPDGVAKAAQDLVEALREERGWSLDDLEQTRLAFINAARDVLGTGGTVFTRR